MNGGMNNGIRERMYTGMETCKVSLEKKYLAAKVQRSRYTINCQQTKCPLYATCKELPPWAKATVHAYNQGEKEKEVDILFVTSYARNDFAACEKYSSVKATRSKAINIFEATQFFNGKTGLVFRNMLMYVENQLPKPLNKAAITMVKGAYGKNDAAWPYCRVHLLNHIKRLRPKVIVAIGQGPSAALISDNPQNRGIYTENRSVLKDVVLDSKKYKVLTVLSYNDVYSDPAVLCCLMEDLRKAYGVYKCQPMVTVERRIIPQAKELEGKENIETVQTVAEVVDHLMHVKTEAMAIDTETKNLYKRYGNVLDTVQFSYEPKTAYMIYVDHPKSPFDAHEKKEVKQSLRKLFAGQNNFKYWVMHNAKFDLAVIFSKLGVRLPLPVICTMMFAFMLDENYMDSGIGGYGLKAWAKKNGFNDFDKEDLAARKAGLLRELNSLNFAKYATNDPSVTLQLFYVLKEMARGQNYLDQAMTVMTSLYSRVLKLLVEMEYNGIFVDNEKLTELLGRNSPILGGLKQILVDFNNSPKVQKANELIVNATSMAPPLFGTPWMFDLGTIKHKQLLYFNVLGLKPLKPPKMACAACKGLGTVKDFMCPRCKGTKLAKGFLDNKGNVLIAGEKVKVGAMNREFQDHYAEVHEVNLLNEYNKLQKLKSSYIEAIQKFLDPENGNMDCFTDKRVRPDFTLMAKTGRARSKNPNSQQIPRGDTPVKKAVKDLYCAPVDWAIVALDYMAVEVRGWGVLSNDKTMREMFIKAKHYRDLWKQTGDEKYKNLAKVYGDIHTVNSTAMYGVPFDKVTTDMRNASKGLTFGSIYGRSLQSVAAGIGCSVQEAGERQAKAFAKFKEAGAWLTDIEKEAAENFYVQSPLGRRRHLWEFMLITDETPFTPIVSRAKRQARNSPIQGFASDLTFLGAALMFQEVIIKRKRNWEFFNSVHDAIYLRVPVNEVKECVLESERFFTTELFKIVEKDFGFKVPFPLEAEFEIGVYGGSLTKWDFSTKQLDEIVKGINEENDRRKQNVNKPYKLKL